MSTFHHADARRNKRHISSRSTSRSTSISTSRSTPGPDDPKEIERDLRKEKEAHGALIQEGGIPSHSANLGFREHGEYELISYWGTERCTFRAQLREWREFREWQQRARRYYIQRNKFSDFLRSVRERRQKMGLEGDVKLHQERDRQSRLDNWMEYQFYHYRKLEPLEKKVRRIQQELESAQTGLRETGTAGFEGVNEPNYFGRAFENARLSREADHKMKLTEQEMELAEQRLKTAEADDSRDLTERAALAELAQKEVKLLEKRLNEIRKLRETFPLIGKVLTAQSELSFATRDLSRHKLLLEWIDQQLSMIASECADANQESKGSKYRHQDQAEMLESVPSSDQIASGFSRSKESSKDSRRSRNKSKQTTAESVLGPVDSSRVSKVPWKKRLRPHREKSVSCSALLPPGEQTGSRDCGSEKGLPSTPNVALRRSQQISRLNRNPLALGSASTSLRPIHSSKVSKAAGKNVSRATRSSTRGHAHDIHSLPLTKVVRSQDRQKRKLDALASASSTGLERTSSTGTTLRRSKRISEKVERSYASR